MSVNESSLLLTYRDVAGIFDVSQATIMRWVSEGRFPSPNYYGSTARFEQAQVKEIKEGGLRSPGTYERTESLRAMIGKRGAATKAQKQRAKRRTRTKKTTRR